MSWSLRQTGGGSEVMMVSNLIGEIANTTFGRRCCRCRNYYDAQRYHESLNNVTPSDVYFGRDKEILQQRERIKQNTLKARRLQHRKQTA